MRQEWRNGLTGMERLRRSLALRLMISALSKRSSNRQCGSQSNSHNWFKCNTIEFSNRTYIARIFASQNIPQKPAFVALDLASEAVFASLFEPRFPSENRSA
jgi:hypothetical protein